MHFNCCFSPAIRFNFENPTKNQFSKYKNIEFLIKFMDLCTDQAKQAQNKQNQADKKDTCREKNYAKSIS